jgi:hypothetical protein
MVYMVPTAALEGFAISSLEQMTAARLADHFDVIVQLYDQGRDPQRISVKGDSAPQPPAVRGGRTNAGNRDVLFRFLRDVSEEFPADHYMLVLWGEALGFKFGRSSDPTTTIELSDALARFARLRGRPLDILGCDACRMSKIEIASVLADSVDLIVASEVGTPFTSWPYTPILNAIRKKPRIAPAELGAEIIDSYCRRYRPAGASLTLLDLKQGSPVFAALGALSRTLITVIGDTRELDNLSAAIKATSRDKVEPMIDLQEFCVRLGQGTANGAVRAAAANLARLLARPFIAKFRKTGPGIGPSRGVGIYVPRLLNSPLLENAKLRQFFETVAGFDPTTTIPLPGPNAPGPNADPWLAVIDRLLQHQISTTQQADFT